MLIFIFYIYLFSFLFYFFIYLAASGLSCGTQDLSLQCTGSLLEREGFSLVVACGFSLSSCGTWRTGSRACGLRSLWHAGSFVEAREVNSCGTRA